MSAWSFAFIAFAATVAILLCYPSLGSLRAGISLLGACATITGFVVLASVALEVEFDILAVGSTENCAALFGASGMIAELRSSVDVGKTFFPPRVTCSLGGSTRTLTETSTTQMWATLWVIGWGLTGLGIALLSWGLWRARRRRG
jgi:hypothetical protein